jgi:ketosteroid isomerase-like protein
MQREKRFGIVTGMDDAATEVWSAVQAVYAGFLADDRDAIDRNISPDATIWDSGHEPLVRGRGELDAVRDARPPDGPRPATLDARDPVIDVFGDVAVVRHVLLVGFDGAERDQRIRNTSVWRKTDGRWLCVHNHEDVV